MLALTINNLHKTYSNGVVAVKGANLQVQEGEFFALLGPNGAGKSSIIGITSSLLNKTSGQITVFGHDLDNDRIAAKACIGLVPQELNFNQFENVIDIVINQAGFYGIGRKIALERAEKYLRQLGLWEKRDQMSRTLSGGMKRRLMIARALMHQPQLLILDEPTAGVDIELRHQMWEFLQKLNADGTTIILTTHYLEEAETLCRNIAIIDKGRIVEDTDMKSLLAKLDVEHFLLDLRNPISELPKIDNINVKLLDERTLEIAVPKSQTINQVFIALNAQNIEVLSLRNKTNRLEELFVTMVEKNLSQPTHA